MKSMKIIFRSCVKTKTVGHSGRPFNLDKKTITLKCFKSLLESCSKVKNKIKIDVIDDSSPKEVLEIMEKIAKKYQINTKFHEMKFGNNGKSLEHSYKLAEKTKEDLIYFCEDDYFHLPETMEEIFYVYRNRIIKKSNFAINPMDYFVWYNKIFPSFIFLGNKRHWRSTINTTGTFIITKKLFKKYKKIFYKFAEFNKTGHGGERETVNKLWENHIPCISPLPSLTAHLHKTSLSPLIDWEKEIEKIKI